MGDSGDWERGGCEGAGAAGWGEGERAQFWYWEEGVGEGDRAGWDREMGEGESERVEGGLRAEAESSENLEVEGHGREGVNTRQTGAWPESGEGKGGRFILELFRYRYGLKSSIVSTQVYVPIRYHHLTSSFTTQAENITNTAVLCCVR